MGKKKIINIIVFILFLLFLFNTGELGKWIFVGVLGCIAIRIIIYVAGLYVQYLRKKSSFQREYVLKLTAWMMGFFFITGTIIFSILLPYMSNSEDVHQFNNVELLLRSVVCSLDMFMLDVDSNILDNLKSYPVLKGLILIQATCSFICTIALLASLIFSRMKAYYILHRKTRITNEKNHLYLFFGLDDNSRLLARSIAANDSKSLTIFIDEANLHEDENDSWKNIVTLFTHRHRTFEIAEDAHALVDIGSKNLSDIPESSLEGDTVDIFAIIGLEKVKQLIQSLPEHPSDAQLHIFFLSDNEDYNIRSLINIAKDPLILQISATPEITHRIYCHARFNGPNRIIEDLAIRKHLVVDIVDSSHLAVELLKGCPDDQPVTVVDLSKEYPTTVTSPLECLIIGFGEVGRDAFRYLYEFASFVEMKNGEAKAARPRITAIDKRMNVLSGLFRANTPAIHYNTDVYLCKMHDYNFLNLDFGEYKFYDSILSKERCESLNYVVIAIGDDDLNIALATNIFNRIRRFRSDLSKLIIMVRCLNDEKVNMMQKVADHFNKGSECKSHEVVRLFGKPQDIYSYKTIIREDLTRKGKRFFTNYMRIQNENDTWEGRRGRLTKVEVSESGEIGFPTLNNLRKLRRQESQDMSNALHIATKMRLLKNALGDDYDWEDFTDRFFGPDGTSTLMGSFDNLHYSCLSDKENEIMLRLAQLEHIRWNAAHEILGYENSQPNQHKCDERTMSHNCLKDWNQLDKESIASSDSFWTCDYKAYDFSVVDTSISIYMNKDKMTKNE